MIIDNFLVYAFEPLELTVEKIGPFQEAKKKFDFTDSKGEPCNFYMLMSENGRGKTTLLELMVALMGMLSGWDLQSFGHEGLDRGEGRAQWDIRLRLNRGERDQTVVLSLIGGTIGEETALKGLEFTRTGEGGCRVMASFWLSPAPQWRFRANWFER